MGPHHKVNAAASSDQPKGVYRAEPLMSRRRPTDSMLDSDESWTLRGSGRWHVGTEQCGTLVRQDRAHNAGRLETGGAGRESEALST